MSDESYNLGAQLEGLPDQIRRFYDAYFAELRLGLASGDLFSEAVPRYLGDEKRVVALGGADGVVVAHFPVDLEIAITERGTGRVLHRFYSEPNERGDAYEFAVVDSLPAIDLVRILSEGKDVGLNVTPGEPWGAVGFAEPQLEIDADTGDLAWRAPWSRLTCADFNSLRYWEDPQRARSEARGALRPYVRGIERGELDEVRAPRAVGRAGVEAGDRGVVVQVFERPSPALLVEYADLQGQTKALATYSSDLEQILDVLVDPKFSGTEGQVDEPAVPLSRTLALPADSSVTFERWAA